MPYRFQKFTQFLYGDRLPDDAPITTRISRNARNSAGEFKWGLSLGNESQINGFGLATDGKRLFAASRGTRDLEGRAGIFAVGD
ncbi:MAG TPA: hypothetical protein VMR25_07400 [Planctomycetaceae bacterium]|nr:hypothetical protein [Planctomycetaceae bacterium]